jgi:hypothetical protein
VAGVGFDVNGHGRLDPAQTHRTDAGAVDGLQQVLLQFRPLSFPYSLGANPLIKNLSTSSHMKYENNTAFFNEWLFSYHFGTTRLSSCP